MSSAEKKNKKQAESKASIKRDSKGRFAKSDKKNGERGPTSFRGGIASPLDKGKKNMIDYKQSGTGAASDLKQKGGEASCPKDESASRRKFSGKSTEAHEIQPWVAHDDTMPVGYVEESSVDLSDISDESEEQDVEIHNPPESEAEIDTAQEETLPPQEDEGFLGGSLGDLSNFC